MVEDLEGLLLGCLARGDMEARGGRARGAISPIIRDSKKADDGGEEGETVEVLGG